MRVAGVSRSRRQRCNGRGSRSPGAAARDRKPPAASRRRYRPAPPLRGQWRPQRRHRHRDGLGLSKRQRREGRSSQGSRRASCSKSSCLRVRPNGSCARGHDKGQPDWRRAGKSEEQRSRRRALSPSLSMELTRRRSSDATPGVLFSRIRARPHWLLRAPRPVAVPPAPVPVQRSRVAPAVDVEARNRPPRHPRHQPRLSLP